jgi:hypothetical protein
MIALHINVRLGTVDIAPKLTPATARSEPGKKMWTEYMKEAGECDTRDADAWKGDSDGILVFVRSTFYRPRCSSQ